MNIYDLYDRISSEFFENLYTKAVKHYAAIQPRQNALEKVIADALDIIEKEKKLCRILMSSASSSFLRMLAERMRNIIFEMNDIDERDRESFSARVDFANGGILACVIRWLDEDCHTDKKILASLISTQIDSLYGKRALQIHAA